MHFEKHKIKYLSPEGATQATYFLIVAFYLFSYS